VTAVAVKDDSLWATTSCAAGGELAFPGDTALCTQGEITLWDAESRQPRPEKLTVPDAGVTDLAFSPDGAYLAASDNYGRVWLWNTADWSLVESFMDSLGDSFYADIATIYGLTFSPDGSQLVIAVCTNGSASGYCRNGEIRVVSLDDFSMEDPLRHTGLYPIKFVYSQMQSSGPSLAASLDCTLISYLGCEKSITLWYLNQDGALPMHTVVQTPSPWFSAIAINSDGSMLLSGSTLGVLSWWDVDPASWRTRACQIAGRNLTQTEWNQYGVTGYSCEQWPTGE
jgi:WD40 repeat protein